MEDVLNARRYWFFGGNVYYPAGGMCDLLASFDDVQSALGFARDGYRSTSFPADTLPGEPMEWWHVFDSEMKQIVARSDSKGYGADPDGPIVQTFA